MGPADAYLSQSEIVTDLICFVQAFLAETCDTWAMTTQWLFWSAILLMGTGVAAGTGYFIFQGEVLSAIFFGLPPAVAIVGSLWLTRNFFAKATL